MSPVRPGQIFSLSRPGRFLLAPLSLFVWLVFSAPCANAQADLALPNRWCPVKTGELAVPEHKFMREGSEVWFCCDECKTRFIQNPESFIANLRETFQGETHGETGPESVRPAVSQTQFEILTRILLPYKNSLCLILFFLLSFLVAKRIKARRKIADPMGLSPKSPLVAVLAKPQTLLILMQLSILLHFIFWDNDDSNGQPPVIIRKSDDSAEIVLRVLNRQPDIAEQFREEAVGGLQPRIDPVYELFAASKDAGPPALQLGLDLRTAAGDPIKSHAKLSEGNLFLHLELDMSRPGANSIFKEEEIGQMTLLSLARSEAPDQPVVIGSEIRLTRSAESNRWQARYPLGEIGEPMTNPVRKAGTLYVCQPSPRQSGLQTLDSARFAIHYSLLLRDGSIDPASAVWLTCLRQDQSSIRARRQASPK